MSADLGVNIIVICIGLIHIVLGYMCEKSENPEIAGIVGPFLFIAGVVIVALSVFTILVELGVP